MAVGADIRKARAAWVNGSCRFGLFVPSALLAPLINTRNFSQNSQ